jgi:hypothetical protein
MMEPPLKEKVNYLASEAVNEIQRPRGGVFRRAPWENVATVLIGVLMLMQPFSMFLFSQSFRVILTGTIMFMIVSHFPED